MVNGSPHSPLTIHYSPFTIRNSHTVFSVIQRTKEVGIRKVLGATVTHIVLLLSKDFAKPVLVAILIALPIAYVLMRRWLEDFAYRVEISWSVFLLVGLVALGIALLTVSYHAIGAATTDPAQTLRYE